MVPTATSNCSHLVLRMSVIYYVNCVFEALFLCVLCFRVNSCNFSKFVLVVWMPIPEPHACKSCWKLSAYSSALFSFHVPNLETTLFLMIWPFPYTILCVECFSICFFFCLACLLVLPLPSVIVNIWVSVISKNMKIMWLTGLSLLKLQYVHPTQHLSFN